MLLSIVVLSPASSPTLIVDLEPADHTLPTPEGAFRVFSTDHAREWLADHTSRAVCVWAADSQTDALGLGWDMLALAPTSSFVVFVREIHSQLTDQWQRLGTAPIVTQSVDQFYERWRVAVEELSSAELSSGHQTAESLDRHAFKGRVAALMSTVYALREELNDLGRDNEQALDLSAAYIPRLLNLAKKLEHFTERIPARERPHG